MVLLLAPARSVAAFGHESESQNQNQRKRETETEASRLEVAIRYPVWENRGCSQIPLTDNQMGIIGRICGLTLIQEKYTDTIMAVKVRVPAGLTVRKGDFGGQTDWDSRTSRFSLIQTNLNRMGQNEQNAFWYRADCLVGVISNI